jgi:hypothetical protein
VYLYATVRSYFLYRTKKVPKKLLGLNREFAFQMERLMKIDTPVALALPKPVSVSYLQTDGAVHGNYPAPCVVLTHLLL